MNDNDPQNIQIILDESLIAIKSGQETIDSILKKYPHLALELRPDLEASLWLSAQRATLEPRPGFISASRARLLADIKQNNPTAVASRRPPFLPSLRQVFQRKYALQFAFIFILFIGFLSSGIVFTEAANRSIPGDPLYTSKLVIEDARLAVIFSDVGHVQLEINFVDRRSYELEQLLLLARYEYIPQTIARFDEQVDHILVDLEQMANTHPEDAFALTASLDDIVENQVTMLTAMAESVPTEVSGNILNALVVTQSSELSINALLDKIIISSPTFSPTLVSQASNTPLPSLTPTPLLTATDTTSTTSTSTLTYTATPTSTPTSTSVAILPLPTSTPTSIEIINTEEPTDTSVPPTVIVNTPTPTDIEEPTNTPETPDPTDIPEPDTPTPTRVPPTPTPVPPTPTPDPGDPTDIPKPTDPTEPPDPTGIPN